MLQLEQKEFFVFHPPLLSLPASCLLWVVKCHWFTCVLNDVNALTVCSSNQKEELFLNLWELASIGGVAGKVPPSSERDRTSSCGCATNTASALRSYLLILYFFSNPKNVVLNILWTSYEMHAVKVCTH